MYVILVQTGQKIPHFTPHTNQIILNNTINFALHLVYAWPDRVYTLHKELILIRWMVIYLVDSAIQQLELDIYVSNMHNTNHLMT